MRLWVIRTVTGSLTVKTAWWSSSNRWLTHWLSQLLSRSCRFTHLYSLSQLLLISVCSCEYIKNAVWNILTMSSFVVSCFMMVIRASQLILRQLSKLIPPVHLVIDWSRSFSLDSVKKKVNRLSSLRYKQLLPPSIQRPTYSRSGAHPKRLYARNHQNMWLLISPNSLYHP